MKQTLMLIAFFVLCCVLSPKAQAQQTMNYIPKTGTCYTGTSIAGYLNVTLFAKWGYGNNCVVQQSALYGNSRNTTDAACYTTTDPPYAYHEYYLAWACYCSNWHYIRPSITANSDCTNATKGFKDYGTCG